MTANLKQLAKTIAASENPYAEFDKHASDMDAAHTNTLSKELNRELFLLNLHDNTVNNDIDFAVMGKSAGHGAVIEKGAAIEKVAACVSSSKTHLVSDDMFLLSSYDNRMIKMASGGNDDIFNQQLSADFDYISDQRDQELLEKRAEKVNRLTREYNEFEYLVIDHLVKKASHEGELRSFMSVMVREDKSDLINPLLLSSNYSMSEIEKTASEQLSVKDSIMLSSLFSGMKDIDNTLSSADEIDKDLFHEKIAGLGSLMLTGAGTIGKGIASALGGTSSLVGKGLMRGGEAAVTAGNWAIKSKHKGKILGGTMGALAIADTIAKSEDNRQKIVNGIM